MDNETKGRLIIILTLRPLIRVELMFFSCRWKVHIVRFLTYLPILSFLLHHSPCYHWWSTYWSGSCTWMHLFDAQSWLYDVWICPLLSMYSKTQNISNPYVKNLQFHDVKLLGFMYLNSILNELYTIFVWRNFSDVWIFWGSKFILYMVSICKFLIWTIKSTFHMSKSS